MRTVPTIGAGFGLRLPARRQFAAADGRLVEALLELLTKVPSTDRHQEKVPAKVAREISRRAAAKAAVTAGSLAMPPGPLGWLTIAPELLAVWTIQAQMVSDLAGIYGKTATLTKEHWSIVCFDTQRCSCCGMSLCASRSEPQAAASRDGCQ